MLAYLNNPDLKAFLLAQLAEHRAADRILQHHGYWKDERGCAVGCTLEAVSRFNGNAARVHDFSNHGLYESELGVPRVIAHLEDQFFERLDPERARAWPERFAAAIPVGVDLSGVWPRFVLWLLDEELAPRAQRAATRAAIAGVAALYREWVAGAKPNRERWVAARHAAYAADDAAYAAYAAAATTYAAADDAAYAAYAATTYAAAAACAADAAASRQECYTRMSDKLVELLEAA